MTMEPLSAAFLVMLVDRERLTARMIAGGALAVAAMLRVKPPPPAWDDRSVEREAADEPPS